MKNTYYKCFFVVMIAMVTGLSGGMAVWADPPSTINLQGTLQAAAGVPATGTHEYRLTFFDAPEAGAILSDTTGMMNLSDAGRFSLAVSVEPLVLDATEVWYQIAVDLDDDGVDSADLFPDRVQLHSVPFALLAADSLALGGNEAAMYPTLSQMNAALADKAPVDHDHEGLYWSLAGNVVSPTQFLGTQNDVPLELRVAGMPALRLIPGTNSPNLVGGYSGNQVYPGVQGGFIGGGGDPVVGVNEVKGDYGVVAGGQGNLANTLATFVGGGRKNLAGDIYDTAVGGYENWASSALIVSGTISTPSGEMFLYSMAPAFVGGGAYNRATGSYSTVPGGAGNLAEGASAVVAGGTGNSAIGEAAVVGGGEGNLAGGGHTVVSGGWFNSASGMESCVGGGSVNQALGYDSTISGGSWNYASTVAATVGGGRLNQVTANYGTVAGGYYNFVDGDSGTVGGGSNNQVIANYGTVAGGGDNSANSEHSTVSGGELNTASGHHAVVGGGEGNQATGVWNTVGGGVSNFAGSLSSSGGATVSGGNSNQATGSVATISGGLTNTATGDYSTIGGGYANKIVADFGTIAGGGPSDLNDTLGTRNIVLDDYGTIGGGGGNQAGNGAPEPHTGYGATVGGGRENKSSGPRSTVAGGWKNTAFGANSFVGGGIVNQATGSGSVVAGGEQNAATREYAFVGGGDSNRAAGNYAVIAGGHRNKALNGSATVSGGSGNTANGIDSVIGGGYYNTVEGDNSTVPGGRENVATGDYSFAAGRLAKALHQGCFVWADSTGTDFQSSYENEFAVRATGGILGKADNARYGASFDNDGNGDGVRAWASASNGNNYAALFAYNTGTSPGIYATSTGGFAGYFEGDINVTGSVLKSAGGSKIDHPLDPTNKYLSHSFVESPDMMNVYNGNVVLDPSGEATVQLPDWFGTLNRDFRYQLTCIGGFAPVYVAEEIEGNQFKIAGGKPGLKVSWQVTGIRQDPYANAHPIVVEQDKPPKERGKYLHPEVYGKSASQGITAIGRKDDKM